MRSPFLLVKLPEAPQQRECNASAPWQKRVDSVTVLPPRTIQHDLILLPIITKVIYLQ